MDKKDISIECKDGFILRGNLYEPSTSLKGAVIISAALGVPRKYYDPFACFLAEQGYAVITYDNRGIGESLDSKIRGREMRLMEWGTLDLEAVLSDMLKRKISERLFLFGHSAGGQIIGLAPSSRYLSGVVFAPASSANWRLYPLSFGVKMLFVMHLMIPVVCIGRDTFPARSLGMSTVDVPTGVMAQWARWARQPDYLFSKKFGIDMQPYKELSFPLLVFGFDDDSYASDAAIEHLLSQYPKARIERHKIKTAELGKGTVGHLGFFKPKLRDTLWQQTLEWLDRTA